MTKFLALCALATAFAFTLAGCDKLAPKPVAFNNVDVTGAQYARDFSLTDHKGQPRTLADFKGKVVHVFFGFTQCPDVCPTTLVEMNEVMKILHKDAKEIQVLFITVDPERDTQQLLAEYVPAFNPSFIGLRGDAAATAKVAQEFKVFYAKSKGATPDSYSIDHTAGSYVFDKTGKVRLFIRHGKGAAPIAQDIKLLLDQ